MLTSCLLHFQFQGFHVYKRIRKYFQGVSKMDDKITDKTVELVRNHKEASGK